MTLTMLGPAALPRPTPVRLGPVTRVVSALGVVSLLMLSACGSPAGSGDSSASAEESSTSTAGSAGPAASGTTSGGGDDDSTAVDVSSTDADDDPDSDDGRASGPQVVQPRTDLVDPRPTRWGSWAKAGPSSVELRFIGGRQECWGVSTTVRETTTTVEIGLSTGGIPGAQACPAVGLESVTRVTLEEPLGDRRVVDLNAS